MKNNFENLTNEQLARLVPKPTYNEIEKYENLNYGHYTGGFKDEFKMNYTKIAESPREQMLECINNCGYRDNSV